MPASWMMAAVCHHMQGLVQAASLANRLATPPNLSEVYCIGCITLVVSAATHAQHVQRLLAGQNSTTTRPVWHHTTVTSRLSVQGVEVPHACKEVAERLPCI